MELAEDEVGYFFTPHPAKPEVRILATKDDGLECIYLTEEGRCGIYQRRPKMCRQWHCSPEGQMDDKEIERRDVGWLLTPMRKEESEFVEYRRKDGPE